MRNKVDKKNNTERVPDKKCFILARVRACAIALGVIAISVAIGFILSSNIGQSIRSVYLTIWYILLSFYYWIVSPMVFYAMCLFILVELVRLIAAVFSKMPKGEVYAETFYSLPLKTVFVSATLSLAILLICVRNSGIMSTLHLIQLVVALFFFAIFLFVVKAQKSEKKSNA